MGWSVILEKYDYWLLLLVDPRIRLPKELTFRHDLLDAWEIWASDSSLIRWRQVYDHEAPLEAGKSESQIFSSSQLSTLFCFLYFSLPLLAMQLGEKVIWATKKAHYGTLWLKVSFYIIAWKQLFHIILPAFNLWTKYNPSKNLFLNQIGFHPAVSRHYYLKLSFRF